MNHEAHETVARAARCAKEERHNAEHAEDAEEERGEDGGRPPLPSVPPAFRNAVSWRAMLMPGRIFARVLTAVAWQRVLTISCLVLILFMAAWRVAGPPEYRPARFVFGNGKYWRYLEAHPDDWPIEASYENVEMAIKVASVWPALVLVRWIVAAIRSHLATPPGHCSTCGYDLRASPVRCPECGTAVGDKEDRRDAEVAEKTRSGGAAG